MLEIVQQLMAIEMIRNTAIVVCPLTAMCIGALLFDILRGKRIK